VYFGGWARMAQPITSFAVVEVAKPNIGKSNRCFFPSLMHCITFIFCFLNFVAALYHYAILKACVVTSYLTSY
jgi:hypothetical protein